MTLEIGDAGPVRVVHATGELDAVVAPELLAGVPAVVEGATAVVLDLSDVTFFDSSGVRLVDRLARTCAAAGAGFLVVAPRGGGARRVLEIVGMAAGLAVDDLETAVASVRPG